jgi:hypothetical protein
VTSQRLSRSVLVASLAGLSFLLAVGCGGESTPQPEVPERARPKTAATEEEPSEAAASEAETESGSSSSCEDGTCFSCGAGVCPQGWYCDESARDGAACSWLPECGKQAQCGCIAKALGGGCACEEAGGGPHVRCK